MAKTAKTEATARAPGDGLIDLIAYDMVRVATENHYSQAVFRGPEDRVIFHQHELIRLCGVNGDLYFAVPYRVDPLEPKRVIPQYIMARQFRELNPAERAYLGLPLFGNWDVVTRRGLAAATPDALARANALARKVYYRDRWKGDCDADGRPPDPSLDPRKFEVGVMKTRDLRLGEQAARRELHPWPLVATIFERRAGEGDGDWRPAVLRGRPGLPLPEGEARALLAEANVQQAQAATAAHGLGERYVPLEFKATYSVAPPEPYEPDAPAAPRSIRFRVSRRSGNVGYVFVPPDAQPTPWAAAMKIARTHDDGGGGMECYNPTPSDESPSNCVCVYE